MVIGTVVLTANSSATLSSATPPTQRSISSALEGLREHGPNTEWNPKTGHYISRVDDWRIVWIRQSGRIVVLNLFAPRA